MGKKRSATRPLSHLVNKKPQHKVPIWSRANWEAMKSASATFCVEYLSHFKDTTVSENWELLANHLKDIMNKNVPTKLSSTRHNVPWLSNELKCMCRKKCRLYKRARRTSDPAHKAAYKRQQNMTRDSLKRAHWSYVKGILSEGLEHGDLKPFYRYVKSQQQDNQGVSPLHDRGQLYSDTPSKARILSDQFKSVFTRELEDSNPTAPEIPGTASLPIITSNRR